MNYRRILLKRYEIILKYTASICFLLGISFLLPLITLIFYSGQGPYYEYFLYPGLSLAVIGIIAHYIISKSVEGVTLKLKEGGVIVILSWLIAIFASALPFIFGLNMSFTHGMFESVSGWTTTGLSVVTESETPRIFLLWRSLMQFMGGAGLAVIALSSILPLQGMGLYMAEGRDDKLMPHVKKSTKIILYIYLSYTIVGTVLYKFFGMNWFDAINHAMAALSTGGFSTRGASIGYWNNLNIEIVTVFLMFAGTVNFATNFTLLKGKVKSFFKNSEIKMMGMLLLISIPLLSFLALRSTSALLPEAVREISFQLISALSTTGFGTVSISSLILPVIFVIIIFMIIGGGIGSTAGGIKQYRIFIMLKSIYWRIKSQFQSEHQIKENYIYKAENRIYISSDNISKIASFIALYLLTYSIGVFIFLAHDYSLIKSCFEFASAQGTVGLSMGITSAKAPNTILWTEIGGMFLGRLEFFIVFYTIVKIIDDINYMIMEK